MNQELYFTVFTPSYKTQDSLAMTCKYTSSIEDNYQFAGVAGLRGMNADTPWLHWGTEDKDSENSKQILSQEYVCSTTLEC